MGISINVYSYWGVRTEWNKEFYGEYDAICEENFEKYGYNEKHPEDSQVDVLTDSYGTRYMVFGVQLYDSGDSRWDEMVNSNEVDINPERLNELRNEYMNKFKQMYPNHYEWLDSKPWRLVNLAHFS